MNLLARRNLHVARGVRRGAELALAAGGTCVIGAASACDLVLRDEGVAQRHCALTLDARGRVTCTALDASVWVGQRQLPPGATMAMPDFLPLRCGRVTLLIGPEGSDWSFSTVAAESSPGMWERTAAGLQRVSSASPAAFAALLLGSTLLVGGSVWATVSWLTAPQRWTEDNVAGAQRWLLSVSPRGSELQLVLDDSLQQPLVVTGYVSTERQREALLNVMPNRGAAPRAEVVSVEQMLAALAQVARRQGLACEAAYHGAGRVACNNEIADEAAAERLRIAASSEVAGLRELALAVTPPPPVQRAAAGSRPYSVLMSNLRGNQLIGPGGRRWSEGDAFDGMTIRRILFDQVVFERDRGEVVLALGQLR